MIRLFVGLSLPEGVRERLHGLKGGVPGARWIEPENMHLTLRFIGNVDDLAIEEVDEALSRVRSPAFDLEIAGVGEFSRGRRPVMLWAGVNPDPDLMDLQRRIESAVVKGGFPPEGRRFTPHVTLARIKNGARGRVRDFIEENNLLRVEPVPVTCFTLFSSHLGRRGASYRAEADYPLAIREGARP
ncbi:MAG TPA: RNA 2',3'-cyclic phosphodiesterase [Alphaproteobacteria bacterium]|nr:RNA 2',3'-cyclic phosphodiesterase [Alphaproteobacteria bacterium]